MIKRATTAAFCILLLASICAGQDQEPQATPITQRVRVSDDKTHFVFEGTDERFVVWGFNYDHDESGRLLEDYWHGEWSKVVDDFREMMELGANVVRIHLQLPKFMESAEQPNELNLQQLGKVVHLAEDSGLYLDVTGLGCYHKQDVPEWYEELDEQARWAVQARFWESVAGVCRASPAIFCYDLMNEPVVADNQTDWLAQPFGDKYFVQRINLQLHGRTREEVAKQWIEQMTASIRRVDHQGLITVGAIPWAYTFKGAKPLFHDPMVGASLDFVSIHVYPQMGDVEGALTAARVYEVGKPLVIEEMFPLKCSIEEAGQFIDGSREFADGWISFYWGKTIEEYERDNDLASAIVAQWLRYFHEQ